MKKETIKRVKLTAAEGMTLTNGESFGKIVFVAPTDNADNWREITDEEAAAIQEELCKIDENV